MTMTVQQRARASSSEAFMLGQTMDVRVGVAPYLNGKAVLQRWSGTTWTTVGNVVLKNGYGVGYVRAAAGGSVAYRHYVPSNPWRGSSVAAAYSNEIAIKVL